MTRETYLPICMLLPEPILLNRVMSFKMLNKFSFGSSLPEELCGEVRAVGEG